MQDIKVDEALWASSMLPEGIVEATARRRRDLVQGAFDSDFRHKIAAGDVRSVGDEPSAVSLSFVMPASPALRPFATPGRCHVIENRTQLCRNPERQSRRGDDFAPVCRADARRPGVFLVRSDGVGR